MIRALQCYQRYLNEVRRQMYAVSFSLQLEVFKGEGT
jgi:hypothetical protein